jgi:hypothetical protein
MAGGATAGTNTQAPVSSMIPTPSGAPGTTTSPPHKQAQYIKDPQSRFNRKHNGPSKPCGGTSDSTCDKYFKCSV